MEQVLVKSARAARSGGSRPRPGGPPGKCARRPRWIRGPPRPARGSIRPGTSRAGDSAAPCAAAGAVCATDRGPGARLGMVSSRGWPGSPSFTRVGARRPRS